MQKKTSYGNELRDRFLRQALFTARNAAAELKTLSHSRGLHMMRALRGKQFFRGLRLLLGGRRDCGPDQQLTRLSQLMDELCRQLEAAGTDSPPNTAELLRKTAEAESEAKERSLGVCMKALHCLKTARRHPLTGIRLMFRRVVRHIPVDASPLSGVLDGLSAVRGHLLEADRAYASGLTESFLRTFRKHSWKGVWIIGSLDMGWHERFKQRHHHLAEFLMKDGYLVLCAMNPAYEEDRTDVLREERLPGMPEGAFFLVNFNDRALFRRLTQEIALAFDGPVFYSLMPTEPGTTTEDIDFLQSLGIRIYYDYFDELSRDIYPGLTSLQTERHERLLRDPEVLICTTAPNLYWKAVAQRKKNVILSRNAVSLEDWKVPPDAPVPPEMREVLRSGRKIVGFYGSFAPWLDYGMLTELCVKRPGLQLVMIGYDYEWGRGAFAASGLANRRNVTIIPAQKYSDLKYFSRFFDVCVIPFRLYELTESVSPVKMFEYMAQGKPVVASPLPECKRCGPCLIAGTPDEFVRQIDRAMELKDDPAYQAKLRAEAAANTWRARADQIENFLESAVPPRTAPETPLLTIAVPAYNMEQYLPVLLGKLEPPVLLRQIEILIVNDGSHDGTKDVALKAARRHPGCIRVIDKENGGHGSCINAGLREARGKYFKLIDADDYPDPAALLMHLNFLSKHDADMVICDYRRFYTDGSTMDISYADRLREGTEYTLETLGRALSIDRSHLSFIHMHAITYRTAVLREASLRITEHSFYVDQEYITYPLPFVKRILRQNIFLYHYLMGRPGQSVDPETARQRSGMNWNILKKIVAFRETAGKTDPALRRYVREVLFHQTWFFLTYTDDPAHFAEILRYWKNEDDQSYYGELVLHFSASLRTRDRHLRDLERIRRFTLGQAVIKALKRLRLPRPSKRT